MSSCIIIGEGEVGNAWHSVGAGLPKYSISKSRYSYMVYAEDLSGLECKITKSSPYYDALTRKVELYRAGSLDTTPFEDWLTHLMFKHATVEYLAAYVWRVRTLAYDQGRRDKANEIQVALGLR